MGLAGMGLAVALIVIGVAVSAVGMTRAIRERAGSTPSGTKVRDPERPRAKESPKESPKGSGGAQEPWILTCDSCGKKLRVPRGRGSLQVTCPGCKARFAFDSDAGKSIG